VGNRLALLERAEGDCVFLRDGACAVYAARPRQCASFPFWDGNLVSEQTWAATAAHCEGISPTAALVSADEIESLRTFGPRSEAACNRR